MEVTFDVPEVLSGTRLDVNSDTCYWFEMKFEHKHDIPLRSFSTVVEYYHNQCNWRKFIRPGSIAIDIGAHCGDTAIPMQLLAKNIVLAIEPNTNIKPYLDLNCNVNSHLGKFITDAVAITVCNSDAVQIFDHCNNMCNGGIIDSTWSQEVKDRMTAMSLERITVPGTTLENLCVKHLTEDQIDNIGFIKIDTEGHDKSIIDSSRALIERVKPVIFTEWFFANTEVKNNELFRVIEEIGYVAYNPRTLELATIDQPIDDLVLLHKTKINEYI